MKTKEQRIFLLVIMLLVSTGISFAQTTHVVTLHVDTQQLNNGNNKKAFSFSASRGTAVENSEDPEEFTIIVNENDEIEWEGESSSGAIVDIEEIEILDDATKPNREKVFKNKKYKGKKKNGKKKIKEKVKGNTKNNVYKYLIRFTIGTSSFEIDPKIKVGGSS
jgi:chromatin remodeling complex protein RSC6